MAVLLIYEVISFLGPHLSALIGQSQRSILWLSI